MDCKEATYLISKSQEEKLTIKERVKLEMHLMACKFCKLFQIESNLINDNIAYLHKYSSEEQKMNLKKKEKLQDEVKKYLDDSSNEQ